MQYLEYLVFVGVLLSLTGCFFYIRSMFNGQAKPNRVTWLLWAIAPLIATAAAVSNGVGWAALPVFMSGFSPLLIFIFSFVVKDAYWKLTKFDYLCGAFALLAIILWAVTKEPNVAIALAIASDGFAAIPTLAKAWKNPESEEGLAFVAGILNPATALVAAKMGSFSEYAFPIYLITLNTFILSGIYRKKIAKIFCSAKK